MPIQLLPDQLISQIAAGEVVERPAAVVKELLENALDAAATQVTIEVSGSGQQLLRIADNGCGIPSAEVALAFQRHATSKLQTADQLFEIATLGFRGEALAAIAAVSRIRLITRHASEAVGTELRLEGGREVARSSVGAPVGTVIAVEDLFFNLPARLKFLKSESAERSQIARVVARYALAMPQHRFTLRQEGRVVLQTSGNGALQDVILAVYDAATSQALLPVDSQTEHSASAAIRVTGFCSQPEYTRANRTDLTFFVNNRWVQDQKLTTAVLQAYQGYLMVNRYPLCVLHISLPYDQVDVNVHPAKTEVRFRQPDALFHAVSRAVRQALLHNPVVPSVTLPEPAEGHLPPRDAAAGRDSLPWEDKAPLDDTGVTPWDTPQSATWTPPAPVDFIDQATAARPAEPAAGLLAKAHPLPETPPATVGTNQVLPVSPATSQLLRVVGQISNAYIVADGPDGLYLIDQHAAHERVLYEAFMAQAQHDAIASQALLQPAVVALPAAQAAILQEQLAELAQIGLVVESFGRNAFLVRALPTVLGPIDPTQALRVVTDAFEEDETPLQAEYHAKLIARVCKRAAVKAGQILTKPEQMALVQALEQCQAPRTCPHGRPTMIHLSVDNLEKQFRRK